MKKMIAVLFLLTVIITLSFAQQDPQKFALVIGNGRYTHFGTLLNAVNDAEDMTRVLQSLGFTVDKVINGTRSQMNEASIRLRDRLSANRDSYGFFFYAGHGVQFNGTNYLIPVNANILDSDELPELAVSVQVVLDRLNRTNNALNIIVLDACRDLPAAWGRTVDRGLAVVHPPTDSIIMYATAAGRTASDGTGRNGLFTTHLLRNLTIPGIEVNEVSRRTMRDVAEASNNTQRPALYTDFANIAYLGTRPDAVTVQPIPQPAQPAPQPVLQPVPRPTPAPRPKREKDSANHLWSIGASVGTSLSAPWLIGSVHGTLAPFRNSFLELGFDLGLLSGEIDVGYYSISPFVHYALFLPLSDIGGFHIGAGVSYYFAEYDFDIVKLPVSFLAMDVIGGFRFNNGILISYTLKTDFSGFSNKISFGYRYRFN